MDILARQVLIVGNSSSFPVRAPQLLPPPEYALRFATDVSGALDIIQNNKLNAIIVEYGGNRAAVRDLARNLRWSGSLCKQATAILLCGSSELEEAEVFLNSGISRILNPEAPDAVLKKALDEVLNHEPRHAVRALVRINGNDLGHDGLLLAQTANLSNTGMLVNCEKQVFLGSRFSFTLEAPGLTQGIRGTASVVRLTPGRGEGAGGFAARFSNFEGDGGDHLKGFLAKHATTAKKIRP